MIEAFRQAVPIIARDLGPFPHIAGESRAGLLFDSETGLSEAVRFMSDNADARADMRRAAREYYLHHWSREAGMREYFSMIGEIAERTGRTKVLEILSGCDEKGDIVKQETGPRPS